MTVPASQRRQVWERAHGCCEYCRLSQEHTLTPHELDHIRSQKHDGPTTADNLALACFYCNSYKGPNVAGFDPETDALFPLFNPRTDLWEQHFEWDGAMLRGLTAVGRITIHVLNINLPERVEHRRRLMESGLFPPL